MWDLLRLVLISIVIASGASAAEFGPRRVLLSGAYNWVLPGIISGNGRDCYLSKSLYYPSVSACTLTVSRASAGTAVDSNGSWSQFGNNVLRLTNLGATIEEGRTNLVKQSTTPITANGWSLTNFTTTAQSFGPGSGFLWYLVDDGVATGAHQLLSNVDIAFQLAANYSLSVIVEYVSQQFIQLSAGTGVFGVNVWANFDILNGTVGSMGALSASQITPLGGGTYRITLTGAPTTSSTTGFIITGVPASNSPRFATYTGAHNQFLMWNAQVELNPLINATVASAVVTAGGTGGTTGTAVYQVGGGTGMPATLNVTVSGGAVTAINSVASAGSYTVMPSSPAALTYVSGTGTGVTGATVTLTPTNNAAMGFATTPILTTNAAVARAADVPSLPLAACSTPWLYAAGTPEAPATYPVNQISVSLNDGTNSNRFQIYRAGGGTTAMLVSASGVTQTVGGAPAGSWNQNTLGKIAAFISASSSQASFDGTNGTAGGALSVPSTTQLNIGSRGVGDNQFNGTIARFAYGCGTPPLSAITNLNQYNYLLRRDFGGPANDNRPMWLREAA